METTRLPQLGPLGKGTLPHKQKREKDKTKENGTLPHKKKRKRKKKEKGPFLTKKKKEEKGPFSKKRGKRQKQKKHEKGPFLKNKQEKEKEITHMRHWRFNYLGRVPSDRLQSEALHASAGANHEA